MIRFVENLERGQWVKTRAANAASRCMRTLSNSPAKLEPAVPVRKSINPDFLICLEDGRKFKSLKRHLRTKYDLSPEDYRAKWGLPKGYPMVAPNYAAARSEMAKTMGLGQGGRKAATAPKRAARKPKAWSATSLLKPLL